MKSKWMTIFTIASATLLLVTGCSNNPYNTGSNPYAGEKAQVGLVTGAAAGAAIGALTSSKKDRGKGALIGAGAGAVLGGTTGYALDKNEQNRRYNQQTNYPQYY